MRRILLVITTAFIMMACGNKNQFTLNGEVIPVQDGTVILHQFVKGDPVPIDSSTMKDGQFKFTGEIGSPELFLLSIEGTPRYVAQIFLEPAKMDAKIYPDSLSANSLTGSESHDLLQEYMEEIIRFSESQNALESRFRQAQMTNDVDEMDAVRFEFETIQENTRLYARNFIKEYKESPVAAFVYMMNFFQQASGEELDSMLNVFASLETSDFYSSMKERADMLRTTGIGSPAPDFTLNNPAGEAVSLSSFQGKYVLIDFWASWCQPCMIEMPNVIEQYQTYNDKGFEIIGVSLDQTKDAWVKTIEAQKMDWTHVWDMEQGAQGEVANSYGVTGIPHTVLLDKEGKIIAKNLRGPALKEKLAELLD